MLSFEEILLGSSQHGTEIIGHIGSVTVAVHSKGNMRQGSVKFLDRLDFVFPFDLVSEIHTAVAEQFSRLLIGKEDEGTVKGTRVFISDRVIP